MAARPPPRSPSSRRSPAPIPGLSRALRNPSVLSSIAESTPRRPRRGSVSKGTMSINAGLAPKTQRTSKVSQKLVVLPSEPQTRPLPVEATPPTHHRSESERMSKEEREESGCKRLTAYSTAEGYRSKVLAAFLKREHGVSPRVFDEAIYAAYHLPLLPGYAPNVNVRSSAPSKSTNTQEMISKMVEAEEYGYDGSYFTSGSEPPLGFAHRDGYISSSPPTSRYPDRLESDTDAEVEINVTDPEGSLGSFAPPFRTGSRPTKHSDSNSRSKTVVFDENIAEVVIFDYGVAVFLGMEESQERAILEDFQMVLAGICVRPRSEVDWEIEQCHFVYDASVSFPRIYNDFFTFKTPSHLLTLSLSHAIAQSTLLAHYETTAQTVLLEPQTLAIPRQLAATGSLKLRRAEALKLTGKLFKLRRDVNLVSNVLETPELFWSEASLKDLYDACRDYFEIGSRVQVLNDRLSVASDLLDMIHEHLNTGAMDKITWIVIWLIVAACLVEFGEVVARHFVHTSASSKMKLREKCLAMTGMVMKNSVPEDAMLAIERILEG